MISVDYPARQGAPPNARRINANSDSVLFYTGRIVAPVRLGPRNSEDRDAGSQELYAVRIIDNDYNTYGQVMDIVMHALGLTEDEAYRVAWEVDHNGACIVARGPRDEAEAVAGIIRTIGIEVQVNPVYTKSM